MLLTHKLIIAGGSLIVFTVVVGFVAFDEILRFAVRDQTALRKRNEIRSMYLKIPFPLNFRIYFFNVSNPKEVQTGATPILEQIGPYTYDEYIEKIDVEDNEGEDSLTYTPYSVFIFNQNKSGDLRDDDYVTILHPLIVGMVHQVNKDTPALLPILNKALTLLFPNTDSIYLRAKVKDILFDGMSINCKVTEFSAKAVCTQLKSRIPGLKMTEDGTYLFSILGPRNATEGKRVKVFRGISVSRNLGRMIEIDGKRELNIWGSKECNALRGTDGWIFPPLLSSDEIIWAFSPDLCRSAGAVFIKDEVLNGINVRQYQIDLGDMEHNEEEKCYCETPNTCLKKGVFDLSKCMGVPIYATLPHFLKTDESYLKQVVGLKPASENHSIEVYLEPLTSAPIKGNKRLQFNFPIAPNSKITFMKTIPKALHPLFWVEEGVELEGALLKKITFIFLLIRMMKILRWVGLSIGILVLAYAAFDYFKERKQLKITPVHKFGDNVYENKLEDKRSHSGIFDGSESGEAQRGKFRSILNGHEFDRY